MDKTTTSDLPRLGPTAVTICQAILYRRTYLNPNRQDVTYYEWLLLTIPASCRCQAALTLDLQSPVSLRSVVTGRMIITSEKKKKRTHTAGLTEFHLVRNSTIVAPLSWEEIKQDENTYYGGAAVCCYGGGCRENGGL
ncbi:hypothetical protein LSAT2_017070 [Lamellibrachia satsuma]|nr:hypothetical protein LSAT2_017070 [Lamellibrachia satsuma]